MAKTDDFAKMFLERTAVATRAADHPTDRHEWPADAPGMPRCVLTVVVACSGMNGYNLTGEIEVA